MTIPTQSEAVASPAQTTNKELEAKLERYMVLKELSREFEALKKELKPVFEGTESIVIGAFKITGSYRELPEKVIRACRFWDMRVKRFEQYALTIGEKGGAE